LRLQLRGIARVALAAAAVTAVLPVRGEDRVTVRGVYYRENSTKVVQPIFEVTKDLPHGFDVTAHGLIDAITSPSILAGVPGDDVLTEYRKEAGLSVGKTFRDQGRTRVGLSYRQSREPDYIAHSVGVDVEHGIWENSGAVSAVLAYSTDTVGPNLDLFLKTYFIGANYTQALSPVALAVVGYELTYMDGFWCNPYDLDKYGRGRARCPDKRLRHVAAARFAYYVPPLAGGFQLHYRFYIDQYPGKLPADEPVDPLHLVAHTVEARVYREFGHGLELRLGYRFHSQGAARFSFCNSHAPNVSDPLGCAGVTDTYFASDQKLTDFNTHLVELKLYWEARGLAGIPVLAWFADGTFELSYGYYFQPTHYGNAHVLQTGYTLPF
jgi:hypothetical protein